MSEKYKYNLHYKIFKSEKSPEKDTMIKLQPRSDVFCSKTRTLNFPKKCGSEGWGTNSTMFILKRLLDEPEIGSKCFKCSLFINLLLVCNQTSRNQLTK